jgi:hypothetical protein
MHTSSPDRAANLGKHLVARKRLHPTGAHVIATANGLCHPSVVYLVSFGRVETLYDTLREQSSRGGGKLHRLVGDLIKRERHALTITPRRRTFKRRLDDALLNA